MIKIISILFLFILLYGCSPVRTRYLSSPEKSENKEIEVKKEEPSIKDEQKATIDKKEIDTLFNMIGAIDTANNKILDTIFEEALMDFDKGNYSSSCKKFEFLSSTLVEDDSLYFESMFYFAECKIMDNNLIAAESILINIYDMAEIPISVREKTLVRLGNINCMKKMPEIAGEFFRLLRKEFPNSDYLGIANCEGE